MRWFLQYAIPAFTVGASPRPGIAIRFTSVILSNPWIPVPVRVLSAAGAPTKLTVDVTPSLPPANRVGNNLPEVSRGVLAGRAVTSTGGVGTTGNAIYSERLLTRVRT